MKRLIENLYARALRVANHRHATWGLAAVSFIESSLFPIPPDVILIPMCIANRKRAFFYALVCTLASVVGGMVGYALGYFFYETIGVKIIEFYGMADKFEHLKATYAQWGGWIIFAKGLTPFPYKIITILSGVMHLPLPVFIAASIVARGMRFFAVAALLWKYGAPVQTFIEKRLMLVACMFLGLIVAGFLSIRYLV